MAHKETVEFALTAQVGGTPVSPEHVTWGQMKKFHEEVEQLIIGSNRSSLSEAVVSVKNGSYGLLIPIPEDVKTDFDHDMAVTPTADGDYEADPKRVEILQRWQRRAVMEGNIYNIRPQAQNSRFKAFEINARSVIRKPLQDQWIETELTLLGRVFEAGGENPNIHVRLRDNPKPLIVWADLYQLEKEPYPFSGEKLLRVKAERNQRTGELRQHRLLEFISYKSEFDNDAYQRMLAAGAEAWRDVKDPVEWVREHRGGGS